MIEIGLTGGIGAGKSTVANGLVDRGAILIDADRVVHDLQQPGSAVFEAMVERWGDRIVADDGSLDRAAVAAVAFTDEAELKALNDLVHPAVAEEMKRRRQALSDTDSVVVLDIPLLVRADGEPLKETYSKLAGIVVIDTEPEIAVERLMTHRGFGEDDARARVANQASREARLAVADFVVDNSGSVEALEEQIDAVWAWVESLRQVSESDDGGDGFA